MPLKVLRLSFFVLAVAFLAAACAPQAAPVAVAPTTAPAAMALTDTPAAAPAATATTAQATPVTSSSTGGGITYTLVAGKTTASYKVREQLAQHDLPNDAIGKTTSVTGAIVLAGDGSVDSKNSKITVDASTLQTDQSMRDNFVRRGVLQTDQYKDIVFVPTAVSGLPSPLPTSGAVTFKLTGDLTIRNVTKPVTWDVTGTVDGDTATGTATTSFKFADFSLSQPKVPMVLSIVDNITLQLDLTLQRSK